MSDGEQAGPRRDATPAAPTLAPTAAGVGPGAGGVYFPALDGLRFVAFGLVYLFHQGVPQWSGWVRSVVTALPADQWPRRVLGDDLGYRLQSQGWIGVQIFFVLSGFLIATLLLREENRYGRIDLKAFWVRRILRIWPLYYATLLLAALALPAFQGQLESPLWQSFMREQSVPFLAFLGNWSMGLRGPPPNDAVSVLWSVCVEEQFYLFCPILLIVVGKRFRLLAVVLLIAAAIAARARLAAAELNPLLFQYNTVTQADALLGGVLLAVGLPRLGGVLAAKGWVLGLLQFGLVGGLLAILGWDGLAHGAPVRQTWDFVLIWAWALAMIAVLVPGRGWLARALAYSRMVWLGRISYGLYMLHEIGLWLGRSWFASLGWFPNKEILKTIACFALTVGLAAVSYYALERPFLKLKARWTRVPSRPV